MFTLEQNVEPVVRVDGASLVGEALSHCHARFYGAGVVVDALACGSHSVPLRLRGATISDRTITVLVTYWLR
jgi:hypothetical protein